MKRNKKQVKELKPKKSNDSIFLDFWSTPNITRASYINGMFTSNKIP
jgi:hypothetical protein